MAGREAEIECLGLGSGVVFGDGQDLMDIAHMRDEIDYPGEGDEAWSHYLNRLRAKTRRLVRRHHKKIERVALALMQPRVLSVEEVDALLSEPAAGSAATEY